MQNNETLVSVVVPIYNVEKYLKNCIETIINQTYKNIEIILVDDGSTDTNVSLFCIFSSINFFQFLAHIGYIIIFFNFINFS